MQNESKIEENWCSETYQKSNFITKIEKNHTSVRKGSPTVLQC